MAESFNTLKVIPQPFANNGTKNDIPATVDQTQGLASYSTGFPPITSQQISQGGKAPKRADFNGMLYELSSRDYFQQIGGVDEFNSSVSTAIGGYPLGAILWYKPSNNADALLIQSLENNNTNTPTGATDSHWRVISISANDAQTIGGVKTFSSVPSIPTSANTGSSSTDAVNVAYLHTNGYATYKTTNTISNIFTTPVTTSRQTYTAPYNGWIRLSYGATCSASHNSELYFIYKGKGMNDMAISNMSSTFADHGYYVCFLKKGETLSINVVDSGRANTSVVIYEQSFCYDTAS